MSRRLNSLILMCAVISLSAFSNLAAGAPASDNTVLNSLNVQKCWTAPKGVALEKTDSQISESALTQVCISTIGLVLTPSGLITEILGEYTHANGKTDSGFRTATQNLAEVLGSSQETDGVFVTSLLNVVPKTCLASHTVEKTCTDPSGDVSYACPMIVCDKFLLQDAVLQYSVKGLTNKETRPKIAPQLYLKVTNEVSGAVDTYKYEE